MKKIFTKLFLLTTLLMVSSELWAQDPLVMCLKSDKQTIPKNTTKDLIYNLPGPGTGLYFHLECDGVSDYYYSIYGYSELDCGGTCTTIESGSDNLLFSDYYNIEGYKSIKFTIKAPKRDVVEMSLDISATYANIPNSHTFDNAGYNSANASKSFTMDYYGEPTTINYEYVTGNGNSGSEKFPISFAYSNGKITMNIQYRHNEIGTHKAEIKLNYSTTKNFTRFYVSGTTTKANQTIAWTPPTELTVGSTHTLSATAPGGAISYAVTGDAVTRSGNTLTAVKAGTVTITASQAGNSNYNAAASVTKTITIKKATPTVTAWPTIAPVTYGTNLAAALVLKGGSASVAGTFVITSSYTAATVPNAGTHTYNLEFRPTESNKYNTVSGGTATLTVNKADQVIAWTATPPTEMTVGDTHTLSATAPGGAVSYAVTGDAVTRSGNTLTAVKAGTVTITASQAGNSNYNAAASVTKTITIKKATPTVTAWPTIAPVTYGTNLAAALVLKGGSASVAGTFVITSSYTAATVPNAGTHTYNLEFRPTESNKYNTVSGGTATLTVNKADQVIAWTATPPTEMTVGDSHTLSATALGGAVAFAITGNAATLADNTLTAVQAGTVTITASQAGNGNYNAAANVTHTITINKATPTVTAWPTLDAVTYGARLEQALVLVGGEASVSGTFAITDSYNAADVPNAGTHTYNVTFTSSETNKYNNVSGTATLTVNKADQVIAWTATPPTELTVGDSHTLSATAPGGAVAFAITSDAATLADNTLTAVQAGTVTITASQAGNGNYNAAANVTHTITINKATPTVTAWPTIAAVTYGASLEQALVLVGGKASVEGTFVIADTYTAATVPNAGTHTYSVEFRPTESNKYNNVSGTAILTVNKADQAIAWTATPPTELTVGDSHTLSATAPGGAVAYAITGDAATLADNTLTAVQAGTVTITASQAGNGNYNAAANVTHTITINKATPTVTAWPTIAAVTYGASLEQALVLVGGKASVEGTFVITSSYTAATIPNAGAYTYSVEFRPTENNKYNNVSGTATLTVNKADQVIAWTATPPTELTVGDSHTLSATAPGGAVAFAITSDAATLADNTLTAVQAGTVTITASQAGNGNYNAAANVTHTITINKATPTVTAWPTIAAVTYGATLEQALILVGGKASVEGTFAITDAYTAATVPNAGAHTYSVEFRPTESNKYNNVSGTATLTVNQATPSVTWPTFAEVTYGTTLKDALQLVGGNANIEGAFHISGEYNEEEVPVVGTYKYAVWFNPTDYTNYTSLYKDDVTLTVNKANQTITWDFADCTLLPGQTLELNATATCGAMTYLVSGAAISVSGTTLTAVAEGTASIKATHAGNENYNAIESPEYTITVSASSYTRTVTNGNYGTICLPYGSSNYSGADFYEIAYAEIKNGDATGLYLDQIEEGASLVAGKPYIFKATADILIVTYEGAIVDAPVAGDAGLIGTLVDIPANDVLVGNYIIAQNMFWDASEENYLNANHAYINKTILLQTEPKSLVLGRRRVLMGETSGNVATDVENSQLPMINSQKFIENGQFIIIRDGVKYNAHGQKL